MTGHVKIDEPFAGLFTQGMVNHETYKAPDGSWLSPAEVTISGDETSRQAHANSDGAAIEIGPSEKMSKSKRNTVDPTDIIGSYGADTARWFMLSDSPPERDVIWTEAGVEGAQRFVQRIWRLINDAHTSLGPLNAAMPKDISADDLELRKASHRTLNAVINDIEKLRFNRAIAHIYEFSNTLTVFLNEHGSNPSPATSWCLREACEFLVTILAPMMPHLAEECWQTLGHQTYLVDIPWPAFEESLLSDDNVKIAVQVNGKRRDELTIARNASVEEVEAAALNLENVKRAIGENPVRKVIVVPERIVNVVA